MKIEELNENDTKLLAYCFNAPRFISDIARNIGIDVKNVSVRIDKLKKMGLVEISFIKNKKFIRTIKGKKICSFMIEALTMLKEKGEMSPIEFQRIFPLDFSDNFMLDKTNALSYIEFSSPPLIEKVIKISSAGESFLKQHQK